MSACSAPCTKVQFAVQLSCQNGVDVVQKVLENVDGVKSVSVDLSTQQVVIDSCLPVTKIQQLIESTNRRAVLQGMGSTTKGSLGAAVSMMGGGNTQGVIRLIQTSSSCVIEGTIDGLTPGAMKLAVHELGDISQGCNSCGDIYDKAEYSSHSKKTGDLGEITALDDGRAEFRLESESVNVWDVIGRSLVIHKLCEASGEMRVSCGIIARSSGLFQNYKQICACDGVTLWDERDVAVAGQSRQSKNHPT